MTEVLPERALNRTLLHRQLLLERTDLPVEAVIDHLVGLQAQAPLAPYVALWSRIRDFRPDALAERLIDRRTVRAVAMLRSTIHLYNDADALEVRPVIQPVLERAFAGSPFARNLGGMDLAELLETGRALLVRDHLSVADLGKRLAEHWPDRDAVSMSYAVRYLVPLVQVPPRGVWGKSGGARLATTEGWLGRPLGPSDAPDALVLRYFAAFGPASVADVATWSWLTGLREVVERLRPDLRTYRDERGRELFDVRGGEIVEGDVTAPVRFLPEYDNVLLSHEDRARIQPPEFRMPLAPGNGAVLGTFLVDGYARGAWRTTRADGVVTMAIEPIAELSRTERAAVEAEADDLLRFTTPEAVTRAVRIAPVPAS